jgi:hypothetical protein
VAELIGTDVASADGHPVATETTSSIGSRNWRPAEIAAGRAVTGIAVSATPAARVDVVTSGARAGPHACSTAPCWQRRGLLGEVEVPVATEAAPVAVLERLPGAVGVPAVVG